MNSAKILVVDDDLSLLDLLVDTLTTIGYQAVGARGGAEALERLKVQSFDLLISDIKMADVDGLSLLKSVRSLYPNLPVLFISGAESPEIIGRARADGFLAKPFRISHIEELIENTLHGRRESITGPVERVLVVDDDDVFRDMLCDSLEASGFKAVSAADGKEALACLSTEEVQAVISDIKMPGMDGIALAGQIKSKYPQLPVILITAYYSSLENEKAMAPEVANGFLRKPFKVEKIIDLLNELTADSGPDS